MTNMYIYVFYEFSGSHYMENYYIIYIYLYVHIFKVHMTNNVKIRKSVQLSPSALGHLQLQLHGLTVLHTQCI